MKQFFSNKGRRDSHGPLVGKQVQVGAMQVRVEALVGQGGYSDIYRVSDGAGRLYALKHLRLNGDQEHIAEVQREAKTMAKLRGHPNILRLHAAAFAGPKGAETDGFLLVDHCPDTLLGVMQRSAFALDERTAAQVFSCVASGIAYMHRLCPPLAHRDLKAENVLMVSEGCWVLCDFGSATTRAQVYTTVEEIAAEEDVIRKHTTPAYRAPEMWDLGLQRQMVDTKVDIWAMGVLLFVLAFGRLPFQGDSKLAIMYGKYEMPPGRHPLLRALIKDMLTVDPAQRPDIEGVLRSLEALRAAVGLVPAQVPGAPTLAAAAAPQPGAAAVAATAPAAAAVAAVAASPATAAAQMNGASTQTQLPHQPPQQQQQQRVGSGGGAAPGVIAPIAPPPVSASQPASKQQQPPVAAASQRTSGSSGGGASTPGHSLPAGQDWTGFGGPAPAPAAASAARQAGIMPLSGATAAPASTAAAASAAPQPWTSQLEGGAAPVRPPPPATAAVASASSGSSSVLHAPPVSVAPSTSYSTMAPRTNSSSGGGSNQTQQQQQQQQQQGSFTTQRYPAVPSAAEAPGLAELRELVLGEVDMLRGQVRSLTDQNQAFVLRIKQLESFVVSQKDALRSLQAHVVALQQQPQQQQPQQQQTLSRVKVEGQRSGGGGSSAGGGSSGLTSFPVSLTPSSSPERGAAPISGGAPGAAPNRPQKTGVPEPGSGAVASGSSSSSSVQQAPPVGGKFWSTYA